MTEIDKNLRPLVGIGVMIMKNGKVLLGKRKSLLGGGDFAWPGGHLEYMESFENCVRREVREETGLEIKNIRFLRVYNMKEYAPKHYTDLAFVADWVAGEPKVLEPERCESWDWYDLDKLPSPLFVAEPITLDSYKTGKNFYDA